MLHGKNLVIKHFQLVRALIKYYNKNHASGISVVLPTIQNSSIYISSFVLDLISLTDSFAKGVWHVLGTIIQ